METHFVDIKKGLHKYIQGYEATDETGSIGLTVYNCKLCRTDQSDIFITNWNGIVPHFKKQHDIEMLFLPKDDKCGSVKCKTLYQYINVETKEQRCPDHKKEIDNGNLRFLVRFAEDFKNEI